MVEAVSSADFQHFYESLVLEEAKSSSSSCSPSNKAQIQRKIAAQLYFAAHSRHTHEDPTVAHSLFNHHLQNYFELVDESKDAERGLDNYAKGALALCSSLKNESHQWDLRDLRGTDAFTKTEHNLTKAQSKQVMVDFDQVLEGVTKTEQRADDERIAPLFVTKLKPTEPSVEVKALAKTQSTPVHYPAANPQGKSAAVLPPERSWRSERRAEEPPKPAQPVQSNNANVFRTAREQLIADQKKKNQQGGNNASSGSAPLGISRQKSLGTRRGLNSPFILPIKDNKANSDDNNSHSGGDGKNGVSHDPEKIVDERLKNIEPKMIELIENEIMDNGAPVTWDDIAGLEFAKKTIQEIVVWPMLRPDIFTGLRGPPKGLLLFGPPGTGKTLIGKCIASQSKSTFFSISASSLTSKWVGEGEKMVRALFAVARVNQPSVVFIDEIDSLLSQRSETEHESSRRIKTEFLVQLDGATTSSDDRLLVVGATNRPQELDEAARRRLVKRLYIPLPEFSARKQIIHLLMSSQSHALEEHDVDSISEQTDGYSCADMTNLCKEAAMGPIRSISFADMEHIASDQVRPITSEDFAAALCQVRASVSSKDLALYEDWNAQYGSGAK